MQQTYTYHIKQINLQYT